METDKIKLIKYWENQSKKLLDWIKPPTKTLTIKKNKYFWFEDGKINVAKNCLTNKNPNKNALIYINKEFEVEEVSFEKLKNFVNKFAYILKKELKDITKVANEVRIMIHGSASIETSVAMLACAQLGIHHNVVFESLSMEALSMRINILKPYIVISRGSELEINNKILKAIKKSKYKQTKVISFSNHEVKKSNFLKLKLNDLNNKSLKLLNKYVVKKSNDPLFSLFTSGSTGIPKGIIHSSAGYLLFAKYTCIKQFGLNQNYTIATLSDAGWINGHTYSIYGPLSCGATSVLFENPFMALSQNKFTSILQKIKPEIIYLPVTLIRLIKSTYSIKKLKVKNLKCIGSMGEMLSPDVSRWYSNFFCIKKTPVINTYFQTETGGIICSNRHDMDMSKYEPGSVGRPIRNINLIIENKNNDNLIKVDTPWPGLFIELLDPKTNNYWDVNNNFNLFDLGFFSKNKNLFVLGRSDDVINIRGHRVGTGEIESILLKEKKLEEVAVISVKDSIEGEKIVVFFSAKNNSDNYYNINKNIVKYFGSYALPKNIIRLKQLPKTKSGKILRRLLRSIYLNPNDNNFGDLSTLINKNTISEIKDAISSI